MTCHLPAVPLNSNSRSITSFFFKVQLVHSVCGFERSICVWKWLRADLYAGEMATNKAHVSIQGRFSSVTRVVSLGCPSKICGMWRLRIKQQTAVAIFGCLFTTSYKSPLVNNAGKKFLQGQRRQKIYRIRTTSMLGNTHASCNPILTQQWCVQALNLAVIPAAPAAVQQGFRQSW